MAHSKTFDERFPNRHTRPALDDPLIRKVRADSKTIFGTDPLDDPIDFSTWLEDLRRRHTTPEHMAEVAKRISEDEYLEARMARDAYHRAIEGLSPLHVKAVTAGCDPELNPITLTPILRQVVDKWDTESSLLLLGGTGQGKTYAATWCAMKIAKSGRTVASTTAANVGSASAEEIARLRSAHVLIIDQLHTLRSPSGRDMPAWQVTPVIDLVDHRYEHMGITIGAGTIAPDRLFEVLGKDVKRRFPVRLLSSPGEVARARK